MDPAACGTDTAGVAFGFRQGVARAEIHEGADILLDPVGRHGRNIIVHGEDFGRRRLLLGQDRHGQERRRCGGGGQITHERLPNSSGRQCGGDAARVKRTGEHVEQNRAFP